MNRPGELPFLDPADTTPCMDDRARAIFSVVGDRSTNPSYLQAARANCHNCHVMLACREYALSEGEPWGMWGGMTVTERSAELRRRARARRVMNRAS